MRPLCVRQGPNRALFIVLLAVSNPIHDQLVIDLVWINRSSIAPWISAELRCINQSKEDFKGIYFDSPVNETFPGPEPEPNRAGVITIMPRITVGPMADETTNPAIKLVRAVSKSLEDVIMVRGSELAVDESHCKIAKDASRS